MIHTFKKGGERFVYDRGSGKVNQISALQFKMLSYLKPPLTEDLPTALRYDLAKYDGGMVEDAYAALYSLFLCGQLFSEDAAPERCADCWASGRCELSAACDACGTEQHRLELLLSGGE